MGVLGYPNQRFTKVFWLAYGGTGSGDSETTPAPFVDADLMSIPAGTIIDKCYLIIDTAITGTTVLEVGDDDDPDGFIKDQAGNFATPGMYSNDAKTAGDYLRIQTAGATDALDVYVVPRSKYYSAAGKELKLNITTANTAGAARVVVEGFLATK